MKRVGPGLLRRFDRSAKRVLNQIPYDSRLHRWFNLRPEYRYFRKLPYASPDFADMQFNTSTAYLMAELSYLSYEEPWLVKKALARATGFLVMELGKMSVNGGQCFVAYSLRDRVAAVIFRGTEPTSYRDWFTNSQFIMKSMARGAVHGGMLDHFRELDQFGLRGIIDQIRGWGIERFFFTGHSLGGALAQIAHRYYVEDDPLLKGASVVSYAFGVPRTGDQAFAESFKGRAAYNIVNNLDFVCRIPSDCMGFVPAGEYRFLDRRGQIHEVQSISGVTFWTIPAQLMDHATRRYAKRFGRLVQREAKQKERSPK